MHPGCVTEAGTASVRRRAVPKTPPGARFRRPARTLRASAKRALPFSSSWAYVPHVSDCFESLGSAFFGAGLSLLKHMLAPGI